MSHFTQETMALTRRWILRTKAEGGALVLGLFQPLIWLGLFGHMFGKVAGWQPKAFGTDNYLAFQTGGIIAFTILNNALMGAVPLLFDRESGYLSKLLAAPMSRSALLLSRFMYVTVFSLAQAVLILIAACFLGVTIAQGALGVVKILLAGLLLCFGFTLLSIALVFIFPGHAAFFTVIGFIMTPILLLSDALMPLAAMPDWLAWLALANPLTHAVALMRPAVISASGGDWQHTLMAIAYLIAFDVAMLFLAVAVVKRKTE